MSTPSFRAATPRTRRLPFGLAILALCALAMLACEDKAATPPEDPPPESPATGNDETVPEWKGPARTRPPVLAASRSSTTPLAPNERCARCAAAPKEQSQVENVACEDCAEHFQCVRSLSDPTWVATRHPGHTRFHRWVETPPRGGQWDEVGRSPNDATGTLPEGVPRDLRTVVTYVRTGTCAPRGETPEGAVAALYRDEVPLQRLRIQASELDPTYARVHAQAPSGVGVLYVQKDAGCDGWAIRAMGLVGCPDSAPASVPEDIRP